MGEGKISEAQEVFKKIRIPLEKVKKIQKNIDDWIELPSRIIKEMELVKQTLKKTEAAIAVARCIPHPIISTLASRVNAVLKPFNKVFERAIKNIKKISNQ